MMNIEILIVEENAVLIKGLRDASENRKIAIGVEAERKAKAMNILSENNFFQRAMEEIISRINSSSEQGRTSAYPTGFGCRSSALRSYNNDVCDAMEEVLNNNIVPILKAKGYRCVVSRHHFCTSEQYFDVEVFW